MATTLEQPTTSLPGAASEAGETAARERVARILAPTAIALLVLIAWEALVRLQEIPHYILPAPSLVARELVDSWPILWPSLLITVQIATLALLAAVVGGVGLALLCSISKWIELSLFPYAVVLQVTPVVSIAPLILIYVDEPLTAVVLCAWIVAFFPILSNTMLGLASADHNLRDLFELYGAKRWQQLLLLRLPTALPYFLGGLRIAGGLSLIGAVVAEYVAGTAGTGTGLAFRVLEAQYRLNIPRMFAGLFLLAMTGVAIYLLFSALSWLLLHRWHESALGRER
ncbi:MAG: ABC transporter permease [Geminicoccaceae bacterium]|nr:ABC transporter permease [Geminicoccaceae bacterium]MCX8101448.1 ABC transporter permease [Geminicoccaceae bacterium]MDW8368692.1 ABC transporter permease [Geminicoccaceae bacterium]